MAAIASASVTFSWVTVGNPGNANDPATGSVAGSVNYVYQISQYDVTNSQYDQFLNAVDPNGTNQLDLFSTSGKGEDGVAFNSAAPAGDKYSVISGHANQPVVNVNWYDAARFTNWLSNGQGSGGTETGVYNMSQPNPTRAANATIFIPTRNEWYKAAYYDPNLNGGAGGYYEYATQSNTAPINDVPPGGTNSANYLNTVFAVTQSASFQNSQDYLTDVGAYSNSSSYYGTFDQAGDVYEWLEDTVSVDGATERRQQGGAWDDFIGFNAGAFANGNPSQVYDDTGFRLASLPEPASFITLLSIAGLTLTRRPKKLK